MNTLRGLLVLLSCLFLLAPYAWSGGCPEGKYPVQLVTPSGNQKTICVSDNAVQGIENAAENSSGLVIPISCPCWTADDISYYAEKSDFFCKSGSPDITCYKGEFPVLTLVKDLSQAMCATSMSNEKLILKEDQYVSCYELIDKYVDVGNGGVIIELPGEAPKL